MNCGSMLILALVDGALAALSAAGSPVLSISTDGTLYGAGDIATVSVEIAADGLKFPADGQFTMPALDIYAAAVVSYE